MRCWWIRLLEGLSAALAGGRPVEAACVTGKVRVENRWFFEVEVCVATYLQEPVFKELGSIRMGEAVEAHVENCEKTVIHLKHPCRSLYPLSPSL
ncbi:MAG: hypothetical protein ACK4SY_00005 [Pyrobaculum sp.]